MKKKDNFSKFAQANARKSGFYDQIAKEAESSGRCVFCNLKDKYIITKKDGWVLTVNLFPRSSGDLMIIPKKHVERYEELLPEDHLAIADLNKLGMELLSKGLDVNSYYLLLRDGSETDKTVRHLHAHVMHYRNGLIDWHIQDDLILPLEAAKKLRKALKGLKNGKS